MTCGRAQTLVETASFMGRSRSELDAARRHAEGCETCRAALAADAVFTAELRTLASPVHASDFTAVVMARIERAETSSLVDRPQHDTDVASWGVLVASALTVGVALAIVGPQAVGDLTAQLPASVRLAGASGGVLQPAFALINIALYVAVLLLPLLTRRQV